MLPSRKGRKLFPQILASFAVWILTTEIGVMCAWSSPYLAKLTSKDSQVPLTLTQASWVASLLYLGRIVGAVLGSCFVNAFGSKRTTLVTAVPIGVGWVFTFVATSPIWLYAARFSLGIGFGCAYSCFALFLGEISAPRIRGSLVSFAVMGSPFGNYLASVTGSSMDLQMSSLTYFVPCVVLMVIIYVLPDSPHHLVKFEDYEQAKKSIEWYQGSESVEEEFEGIVNFVKTTGAMSFTEKLAEFKLRHVRRATVLVMMLFAYMQLSGLNSVLVYMEMILERSGSKLLEPSVAVSYVLISGVLISLACIRLYDVCGRRALMLVSSAGVALALLGLGGHFMLLRLGLEWSGSQWLPLASLFLFNVAFVPGLGAIPSVVGSEVYSANAKPVAACLANLTAAGAGFLATKAYQPLVDLLGEPYVFWGHAIITLTAVPYVLLFMPETKGRSLAQIQEDLLKD